MHPASYRSPSPHIRSHSAADHESGRRCTIRRGHMHYEGMNQNHVSRIAHGLDHLQWNSIYILYTHHEALNPLSVAPWIVKIAHVGVLLQQSAHLSAACPARSWVLAKPLVHESVRTIHHQRTTATRGDIPEQRQSLDASYREQRARIVGIDVPAAGRYTPRRDARKGKEECSPVLRLFIWRAPEDHIDRRQQGVAADCLKYRITLQMLKVRRPRHC